MNSRSRRLPCLSHYHLKTETMTAMSARTPDETARKLVADMTEDEKLWCLDGDTPFWAGLGYMGRRRLPQEPVLRRQGRAARTAGLRASATARVASSSIGPTCFPVSMAEGATWDVDLEERIGDAIGRELRAIGADLYGGVCVNVLRHPAWGRAQETYGEDPHHVGEMGAALTRGIQRHAMACVKHFACNSMENARFQVDIEVDEVALHEVYLPHFKRIIDEGVAVRDERVQQRQRRVLRRQRAAAHRRPARRMGLRGLRDQRLDLRDPRRCEVGRRRPRRRDALSDGAGRQACATR